MTKLWALVHYVVLSNLKIRDNVTDFYLDHIDAKHLLADVKDGHIVISEKADSDDSKDQDKAEK